MITGDGIMKIRNRFVEILGEGEKIEFSFCFYFIKEKKKPKVKIFVYKYNDYNYVYKLDKYCDETQNNSNIDITLFSAHYPRFESYFKDINEVIHKVDIDIIKLNYTMGDKSEYEISEFKSIADVGGL